MDDERERTEITVEDLLSRYAAGERNFTNVIINDFRGDFPKGVDLSGINLQGSYLSIDFSGSVLKRANFKNTVWGDHCSWENADFSGSDFTGITNDVECFFVRCNFRYTDWDRANLWQSTFEDCDLTGADFDNASLIEVDLYG